MAALARKPDDRHPGPLHVNAAGNPRQYEIASGYMRSKGDWDDVYVSFSGFFGSYGPNIFAAAPEMLEALKKALVTLSFLAPHNRYPDGTVVPGDSELIREIKAAIAKATEGAA